MAEPPIKPIDIIGLGHFFYLCFYAVAVLGLGITSVLDRYSGFCKWAGGAYFYVGPLVIGHRTTFEHWGWWGKALFAGHYYLSWVVPS